MPNKDETINLIGNSIRINRIEEIGYWRAAKSQFSNVVFRDEVPTLMRLLGLIQPNTTFVDCGANVGLFSATVSHLQKIYCQLRIYSFEPHPHTFKRLTATLEGTRTEIRNFALSNREGTLEVFEGATSGVFGVASTQSHFQILTSKTEIACKRLDSLNLEGDQMFLKIDVEGHELEVLEGASTYFEHGRVSTVFIDGAAKEQEVLAFLRHHHFNILNVNTLEPFKPGDQKILAVNIS